MRIVGIRFRSLGKVYSFDALDIDMKVGDGVIVETNRGIEYGWVVYAPREALESESEYPLREVLRLSTSEDDALQQENQRREKEAYRLCLEKIREHGLQMKLIAAEYTFNNKIMFYFTADGRVDFRLLVKDLAAVFKTRIELRQVGVRDETKFLGGIGICGRSLCCNSYLTDFVPVSIRMAKDQNLSLNQTKISGVCGRLMCCLKYEQETYEYLNKTMPNMGELVILPDGMQGRVVALDVLRQTVKVSYEVNDEIEVSEYYVEEISYRGNKARALPKTSPEEEGSEELPMEGEEEDEFKAFHREREIRPTKRMLHGSHMDKKDRGIRRREGVSSSHEEGEQKALARGGRSSKQGRSDKESPSGKGRDFSKEEGRENGKKFSKKKSSVKGQNSVSKDPGTPRGEGQKKKDRDRTNQEQKKKRYEKGRRSEEESFKGNGHRKEGLKKGEKHSSYRRGKNAPDFAKDE